MFNQFFVLSVIAKKRLEKWLAILVRLARIRIAMTMLNVLFVASNNKPRHAYRIRILVLVVD